MRMVIAGLVLCVACTLGQPQNVAHFARGVGLATATETIGKTNRVLALHQFEVEREEGAPNIYVETRWRDRTPFDDEQNLGITVAQIRAIVRARPRSNTSQLGQVYTVDMTIEQRVRVSDQQQWTHETITPSARAYATRIAEDLRRELNVGVRRY